MPDDPFERRLVPLGLGRLRGLHAIDATRAGAPHALPSLARALETG
jgi:hypothetical protein